MAKENKYAYLFIFSSEIFPALLKIALVHKIGLRFFQLGFSPSWVELPLQGMELQEKEAQKEKIIQKISLERTMCLLILDILKPLRSYVKGKHSIGREFQSLAVRGKKLLTKLSI